MSKSIMEMVAAAKQTVPPISPADAAAMMGRDDVLVVDVRDLHRGRAQCGRQRCLAKTD